MEIKASTKSSEKSVNDFDAAVITHYLGTKNKSYEQEAYEIAKSKEWLLKEPESPYSQAIQGILFKEPDGKKQYPFPGPKNGFKKFSFIDLFAGIGGFRIAMQNLGGKCVFTSEWDKAAQITYEKNFGERPFGDITNERIKGKIPSDFDVLCAGFPCQAFSIAGKRGGFEDTRGTLFYDVAEIIRRHKPKAFFLENVKGLRSHDKGKTLQTILNVLRNDLGYFVPEPQVINAKDFGVPQNRERIFIAGFREDLNISEFKYPEPLEEKKVFEDI